MTIKEIDNWLNEKIATSTGEDCRNFVELENLFHTLIEVGVADCSVSLVPLKLYEMAYESFNK